MLRLALVFFIISLIAGLFGFTTIAGAASTIAQIVFFTFLALCILMLVAGLAIGRSIFRAR